VSNQRVGGQPCVSHWFLACLAFLSGIHNSHLLAELDTHGRRKELLSFDAEHLSSGVPAFPDESALADHIRTLLQAIDRLRDERDGLKRALEFSEVEHRINTEGFQTRIASLTKQLTGSAHDIVTGKSPTNTCVEQRMKRLTSCAAAFTVVISNLQTRLDLSEDRLSATSADLASSNSQLYDAIAVIGSQKQLLVTNAHEHDVLLRKLDAVAEELSESDEERGRLRLQLADVEGQVDTVVESAEASESAREEAHQNFLLAEQRFATLNKNCQDIESERNSLALQITNLQDDLTRVQEDLADAQNRYNILHAQQLSAMTTSEVVQALKDRIKELEARIVQGTDQIGDYQHDVHRLEANVKLHEERITEMTADLELLASQKEAMVEDCAEAREARDEAIERSEAAEEEAERLQQQLQQAKHTHEVELSAMSPVVANLTSENQHTTARLADSEAKGAGFIRELDTLSRDHQHLGEQLNAAASRSRSLELENSKEKVVMQQAVISLAVVHRIYKESARQLQRYCQHVTSLESQLVTLNQELEQKDTLIDSAEKEKHVLLQRLSDVSTATDRLQDDPTSRSRLPTTAEELSSTCAPSQQQEDHGADSLRNSLQEKELEMAIARQLLEETKARYADIEAELLERIATMTMELQAHAGQAEDIADLHVELENVRTQLQNSLENFSDLENLHGDVIQDFITVKEVFERRLTETEEQIRTLEPDYQHSLASMEAKYKHEADILTSNLEDRERELDELRQQFQDMSEAHTCAEGRLHEELNSYEARHALVNDLEKDLRRTVAGMRQRLAQAEAETLTLHEERQLLQAQITGLQAEIQRSASLTRYLESQVRER
jgi:chromosome segregation ATPase